MLHTYTVGIEYYYVDYYTYCKQYNTVYFRLLVQKR